MGEGHGQPVGTLQEGAGVINRLSSPPASASCPTPPEARGQNPLMSPTKVTYQVQNRWRWAEDSSGGTEKLSTRVNVRHPRTFEGLWTSLESTRNGHSQPQLLVMQLLCVGCCGKLFSRLRESRKRAQGRLEHRLASKFWFSLPLGDFMSGARLRTLSTASLM